MSLILLAGTPAGAQQADPRQEFAAGVSEFEASRYEEALQHFQRAFEARPHPTLRVNLANCYVRLDRPAGAVLHYRAYLADPQVRIDRPTRRAIQDDLQALEQRVGTLELTLTPADAEVLIDGRAPEAREGSRILLPVGRHTVAVGAAGHRPVTRYATVAPAATAYLQVSLEASATPPPPAEAAPRVEPAPPAEPAGLEATPPLSEPPAPAPLDTRVEPVGASSEQNSSGGSSLVPPLRIAAASATAALAITTVILGVLALEANSSFDDAATRIEHGGLSGDERARLQAQARDDAGRADDLALAADLALGLTIGAGAATAVLFLVAKGGTSERAALRLDVASLRGGAGLQVGGHF